MNVEKKRYCQSVSMHLNLYLTILFIIFVEKNGVFSDKIEVTLPKNTVSGSVHATISAIG